MLYTKSTKKAMRISFDAHKNQVDKAGLPYVYHPFHLAEQMKDENSICVALLHDVVEDTNMTFEDLKKEGFNDDIINALKLLTHDENVPYMDYVKKIKENRIARAVKIADLKHNTDLTRLDLTKDQIPPKYEIYKQAIEYLEN